MIETRFNEGILSEGLDGMQFADVLFVVHFLQKNLSVWKELLKDCDTVKVNFTKSGNHNSSFTKVVMMTSKKWEVRWNP
jgi:hypothetical protein